MVPVASLVGIISPFTPVYQALKLAAAVVLVNSDRLVAQVTDVVVNLARGANDPLPVVLALALEGLASGIPTGVDEAVPDVVAA